MVTGNVSATYGPLSMPSMPGSVSVTAPGLAAAAATSAGVVPGFAAGGIVSVAPGSAGSALISVSLGSSATISEPDVTTTLYLRTRTWTGSNQDCPVLTSNSQPCHGQRTISPGRLYSYSPTLPDFRKP